MTALAFDTRRFVKNLTEKGMKPELANALGDEMTDLMTGRLATKDDIEHLKGDIEHLKGDIEHLKDSISKDIDIMGSKLWNRLLGTQIAFAFVIVSVVLAAVFGQFYLP